MGAQSWSMLYVGCVLFVHFRSWLLSACRRGVIWVCPGGECDKRYIAVELAAHIFLNPHMFVGASATFCYGSQAVGYPYPGLYFC